MILALLLCQTATSLAAGNSWLETQQEFSLIEPANFSNSTITKIL